MIPALFSLHHPRHTANTILALACTVDECMKFLEFQEIFVICQTTTKQVLTLVYLVKLLHALIFLKKKIQPAWAY